MDLATTTSKMDNLLEWVPAFVMVVAIVFISVMMTISIRRKIAARQARRPDPRRMVEDARTRQRSRDELDVRTADFLATAKQVAAQLDNKARRLEILLDQAQRTIDRLDTLEQPQEQTPPTRRDHSDLPDPAKTSDPSDLSDSSDLSDRSDQGDPLADSVRELAADGRSALEIAQQLNEQVGKVELILALNK